MNIRIISVGKIKEKYIKDGINEYKKRLSRYCFVEIIEVPDEKAPETLSLKEEEAVKDDYAVALDLRGKMLTSPELSSFISEKMISGTSTIDFIIGGSLGLSKRALKRADFSLCFSRMTFPHQLMRMILLEQIYRSFKIMRGEPYHK